MSRNVAQSPRRNAPTSGISKVRSSWPRLPAGTRSRGGPYAFAYTLSHEVRAVHVSVGDETEDAFCRSWSQFADAPARAAGLPPPQLVVIDSPYRLVPTPILNYVLQVEKENPGRQIAGLLPEMVESHWYHYFLHNQRACFWFIGAEGAGDVEEMQRPVLVTLISDTGH